MTIQFKDFYLDINHLVILEIIGLVALILK